MDQAFIDGIRDDLWRLRNTMPARPVGEDTGMYLIPARFYLEQLRDALTQIEAAEAIALTEVPADLQEEAKQSIRRGHGWAELAAQAPEMRRYWQVVKTRELVEALIDDLANEGRPRPEPDLRVGKMRFMGAGKL